MGMEEAARMMKLVAPRYAKTGRLERSGLLTEMRAVTGLHRKCVLWLTHGPTPARASGRPEA